MLLACCLGQGHPKDLANDEHRINNNQMQTKTVFGRVCSSSLRTTTIHTKTKSQHFYAVGRGTLPGMKFRRVQANKGMQPKRAKGQHCNFAASPFFTTQTVSSTKAWLLPGVEFLAKMGQVTVLAGIFFAPIATWKVALVRFARLACFPRQAKGPVHAFWRRN